MSEQNTPNIKSFAKVEPMIYAYDTPGVSYHDGWIKIGYTNKQTPEARIRQQTQTADITTRLLWKGIARYTDNSGESFTDKEFHAFLEIDKGVERRDGGGTNQPEWFRIEASQSLLYFNEFAGRGTVTQSSKRNTYTLRAEQEAAVEMTKAYFEKGGKEFLWNAKPRFGKTLTAYDLVCRMGFQNVLIVTNRPSIANAWAEDFQKFIGWKAPLCFVSENDSLKDKPGVLSREEYKKRMNAAAEDEQKGMIAFESLQGLKGSSYFGGKFDKLEWMAKEYKDNNFVVHHGIKFDLLIIDEAQEGIETIRTERAFDNINRDHTLYLSGTPFKQLASAKFSADQIFNWSYADEQERKAEWDGEGYNPYEPLPSLAMYTYQMSDMIRDKIKNSEDFTDYAFDLNEFFAVDEQGKFYHEKEIKRFLQALSTQEKYPFSTPQLRKELSHTLWYLNRIASVEALEKLLKADPVFGEYYIVKVVGDGSSNYEDEDEDNDTARKNFDRVKNAIAAHEKTITLTVGQLTVGVTVPEWSAVLMLCNLKSPSSYMQAAFRAQNPCMFTVNGETFQKETSYIFDFDPARTLIIFDEFANNLGAAVKTTEDRKANIKRLLNFFPVIGEDDEGRMIELDAAQVLSIPGKLKCQEVVRAGFMCNYLFNIGNVFNASAAVMDIVKKLQTAQEEKKTRNDAALDNDISVDENGDVKVPEEIVIGQANKFFADKIYDESDIIAKTEYLLEEDSRAPEAIDTQMKKIADSVKDAVKERMKPVMDEYDPKKAAKNRIESQIEKDIEKTFRKIADDYRQEEAIAKAALERSRQSAKTEVEVKKADEAYESRMQGLLDEIVTAAQNTIKQTIDEKPVEVIEQLEKNKLEAAKHETEEEVRAHLRGFSRTIPSFIMAYGDDRLTLANFDKYVNNAVFMEVTGIGIDDFLYLRDGGDRIDPVTGKMEHWEGHLFDETVFNDSIKEFLNKKRELANYFDESQKEDIFDYIPPQKTNQIFTPKRIVKQMVDMLEEENPGCFDDPDKTFADLYMKSGLYVSEIVKRIYQSEKMREIYPDGHARLKHIFEKQVYGLAPTEIIYRIAVNFILGFDEKTEIKNHNFRMADTLVYAKEGKLEEFLRGEYGI